MHKKILVLTISAIVLAADAVLANIPGPVPTAQAIYNVEHDPLFISLTSSRIINGTTFNGTYTYFGYSNDPARDFGCVNTIYSLWLHYLNPFHQYATTTLRFPLEFTEAHSISGNFKAEYFVNLFVQVNPTTGQIYNTSQMSACASGPPPPGVA